MEVDGLDLDTKTVRTLIVVGGISLALTTCNCCRGGEKALQATEKALGPFSLLRENDSHVSLWLFSCSMPPLN